MKLEEIIGEISPIFGAKRITFFFQNIVIQAIIARQENIPTPSARRSGSARSPLFTARSMRNILHPKAHGVNPVIIARKRCLYRDGVFVSIFFITTSCNL